ncbi:MAG TPA: enoyl-CoA hydratase/isomerase family protein [Candidatus Binatia bacterium]|jgi:enoyl-CoA hydratase/carnithine racemase|nr:enoyl-CoA hydratase/isomerase family protein [Candidatus Binatia bacterium]
MSHTTLTVEHDGPITRVWLDRPAKLNALNPTALEEIVTVFDGLQQRFDTQVVVLGGRGRAFCAGADRTDPPARLARGSGAGARERRWVSQLGRRALEAIERCEAITIARLHGHVIGGGVVLAMACDFRLAAASALLHVPEVDLGIPLTWGAVPRLIRELGMARAKEVVLLCDRIDAARAERLGLLNAVVADEALDATVDDWARRLAAKPPWAVHMTKTQFQAYGQATTNGDVTASDGDLLAAATAEDPSRFMMPSKT